VKFRTILLGFSASSGGRIRTGRSRLMGEPQITERKKEGKKERKR